jgi:DNA-binding winged helix-turn-helix (wHTH) protein
VVGYVVAVPGEFESAAASPVLELVSVPGRATDPADQAGPADRAGLVQCLPGVVLDTLGRRVVSDGEELDLTRREFELLEHLATHPGRVFTREQLMATVWDLPHTAYTPLRTVDVHVSRLRRKLGRHGRALQSLRGVGYRWSGRPAPAAAPAPAQPPGQAQAPAPTDGSR